MSSELERAYAALSRDAGRARLAPAADLRRRASRQTAVRSAATLVAVAVLATGATVGTRLVLAGDQRRVSPAPAASGPASAPPTAAPAPSVTPSAAPPPSSAPPAGSPSAPKPIPKSIPARALLTVAEGNVEPAVREDPPRKLELCDKATFPSEKLAGVRASVRLFYREPRLNSSSTPSDTLYNTVTVYRSSGAAGFMDDLRAAVKACPQGGTSDLPARYRSLGAIGRGDESVLIESSTTAYGDDGTPAVGRRLTYIVAVRVGDAVTLLETLGYESAATDLADVKALARAATERLTDWRR